MTGGALHGLCLRMEVSVCVCVCVCGGLYLCEVRRVGNVRGYLKLDPPIPTE